MRQGILKTCTILIKGIETSVELDTNADTNIMVEYQFWKLQTERPEMALKESTIKLKILNHNLPIMGECTMKLENQMRAITTTIVVVKWNTDSTFTRKIKLGWTWHAKDWWIWSIKMVQQSRKENRKWESWAEKILDRYRNLFQGVGKATRNGHKIKIHLPIKQDAIPIAHNPRRVPYYLIEPLQSRIKEFIVKDIMEKVHEVITWCSPLVVKPKPKNPKDIRVSLDLPLLNKSMLCTGNIQAPITEDFVTKFREWLWRSQQSISVWSRDQQGYTFVSGTPKVINNDDNIMIGGRDCDKHNTSGAREKWWFKNLFSLVAMEWHQICGFIPQSSAISLSVIMYKVMWREACVYFEGLDF